MAVGVKTGGRQKGTPNKATADVKAAAQVYSAEAIKTLAQIMRTGESEAARIAAANAILDRAHGKPTQSVDMDANVHARIALVQRRLIDPSGPVR